MLVIDIMNSQRIPRRNHETEGGFQQQSLKSANQGRRPSLTKSSDSKHTIILKPLVCRALCTNSAYKSSSMPQQKNKLAEPFQLVLNIIVVLSLRKIGVPRAL